MAGCITRDLKDALMMLIDAEVPLESLRKIIENEKSFPLCSGSMGATTTAAAQTSTRSFSPRWPPAVYIDPNKLYEVLTGTKLSGSICTGEGEGAPRCYPATTVESFRIQGYTVQGNGEDPPASDPTNWLSSNNVKRRETIDAHEAWKEHLKATGKKFVVIDPIWIKRQTQKEGIE